MEKSKKYFYDYDEYEKGDKSSATMVPDIMADPELPELEEVIIGCWGAPWEYDDCQDIIDALVENKDKFSHIKSLFVGDMDYEECEVSWIVQGDYSKLWAALPQLEKLTIKGSSELELGTIQHDNLKDLEIICGGLPVTVIESIQNATLPQLERLMLYIGVDEYGFDGDVDSIQELLEKSNFPKLTYLGITDSEMQNELVEVVLNSKYIKQIEVLDVSYGSLTDEGGNMLIETLKECSNVKKLIIIHHFLSDQGEQKLRSELEAIGMEVILEDKQCADGDDDPYYYAMLTE